ncbi:MAG: ABC transporter ATP-binding protein [Pseudomonadota bacterium]
MGDALLTTDGLSRSFGELRAVDAVSLEVAAGSMTGLIGPNGAGKTTFFNLLTGALKPSGGTVRLDGRDVTGMAPDRLFGAGLGRTFQIPRPFARMSVLENVMLAPLGQTGETIGGPFLFRGRMREQERRIRARALEVLDFVTLGALADHPAGQISGGQMKLLELARVLIGDPKLILLDEPAAGVNPVLTETLIGKIEELNRGGTTFVIIEHDMDFVMRHCDPVIAMAEGRVIFQGTSEEALANPVLLDAYLGAREDA